MFKVLIIDDEPWARKVIKKLGHFEELGLEIIGEASDGIEGLEKIESLRPDIVITDMRMPGIDGSALLKRVNDHYSDMMIIAMSGYNDFIYLKQAIKASAVDYLLKPVSPDELNDALIKSIKGLNQKRKGRMTGLGTLHLFEDEPVMKGYLESRQHLYESLIGLKTSQCEKVLNELGQSLSQEVEGPSLEIITKIGHDLIEMLEAYVANNEDDLYDTWKHNTLISASTVDIIRDFSDMFDLLRTLYVSSINDLILSKKQKKHLDTGLILEFINHHYTESISLDSIAAHFFITKEHLSRTYKSAYGITINEQLIQLRMDKAKALIIEKHLAIKDVAMMVGYHDLAYFYRVFKKHVGLAPGEYRNKHHINKVQ